MATAQDLFWFSPKARQIRLIALEFDPWDVYWYSLEYAHPGICSIRVRATSATGNVLWSILINLLVLIFKSCNVVK